MVETSRQLGGSGTRQRRLLVAAHWSGITEFASRLIQPLVYVALAWLLMPEEFGTAAIGMMAAAFCAILWENGLSRALVRTEADLSTAANIVFWTNAALAAVLAAVLIVLGPALAEYVFGSAHAGPVLQAVSLHVVLGAAGSVPLALLQREMRFERLFGIRMGGALAPPLISIPLAAAGAGYWALVVGAVAGQAVQTVMLWRRSGWRPGPPPGARALPVARGLAGFGGWVVLSSMLGWLFNWGDTLVVAHFLAEEEVGLYRFSTAMATQVFALVFAGLSPVLFAHFSGLRGDPAKLARDGSEMVQMMVAVAIPLGFLGFATLGDAAAAVFGARWSGLSDIAPLLFLASGFSWAIVMNVQLYRAAGRPAAETAFLCGAAAVYAAGYLVSIRFGFESFVWTRLGLAAAACLAHLAMLQAVVGASPGPLLRQFLIALGAGLAIVALAALLRALAGEGLAVTAVVGLLGLALTGASLLAGGHLRSIRRFFEKSRTG